MNRIDRLSTIKERALEGIVGVYENRLNELDSAIKDYDSKIKDLKERKENLELALDMAKGHLQDIEQLPSKRDILLRQKVSPERERRPVERRASVVQEEIPKAEESKNRGWLGGIFRRGESKTEVEAKTLDAPVSKHKEEEASVERKPPTPVKTASDEKKEPRGESQVLQKTEEKKEDEDSKVVSPAKPQPAKNISKPLKPTKPVVGGNGAKLAKPFSDRSRNTIGSEKETEESRVQAEKNPSQDGLSRLTTKVASEVKKNYILAEAKISRLVPRPKPKKGSKR